MKNYGTKEKLWYYGKTYGTIPRTMELQVTKEKDIVDYQNLKQKRLFIMENM